MQVACSQITWGSMSGAETMGEEQILAEIARAGYDGAPASPRQGRSAAETTELYGSHGLLPAPGYLSAEFWRADQRSDAVERARFLARFTRETGCTELYVAASGFDYRTRSGRTRRELAGHVGPDDALSDSEFEIFAEVLNDVGRTTLDEGVRSCFHNHVGTVIETREEIDRLLDLVDPTLIFLGPDTGHLAWAGVDVTAFCQDYADRILTMHLKDVDESVASRGRAEGWDYHAFTARGVFAELGEGSVDFPALFDLLRRTDFTGWLIAETDVTQKLTALESASVSREYLRSVGV